MSEGPETMRSTHSAGTQGEVDGAEETAFLVRALECDQPLSGSSRHTLQDVDEVHVVRGARGHERVRRGGRNVLQVSVPDPRLSSRHAKMRREFGTWLIEDLGSTNGTFVAGKRVESAELRPGDAIDLGSTLFLFQEREAPRSAPPDLELRPGELGALTTLNPELSARFERFARVAGSELPVLVLGETGTGKDLLARALHERSSRAGPLVAVNCGAIPATLMEAQLFGVVKGAYTGAVKDELGFVRSADRGTLFLDEIAELPSTAQAALLRVLQSGEVMPVGSARATQVSVRVVAATHQDLDRLISNGAFRRDLYARLAGFVTRLPALRERREDLGLLIGSVLLERARERTNLRLKVETARALFAYSWPLNVRELVQGLSAALVLAESDVIAPQHLPDSVREALDQLPGPVPYTSRVSQLTLSPEDETIHATLVDALTQTAGNVSETARRLGKARQQVQRWLRRFELDPAQFRKR